MKAVRVEWIDSHHIEGWTEVDKLAEIEKKIIITIGWLVRKDKEGIVIANSLGQNPEQVCGIMCIPTTAIVNIKTIKGVLCANGE